jgi:cytochrome c peroxidase
MQNPTDSKYRPKRPLRSLCLAITLLAASTALAQTRAPDPLREQARQVLGTVTAPTPSELQAPAVLLGQALFWDQRLSLDGNTACASCHFADKGGADSRPRSPTARGTLTTFNSMTVFNTQDARAGLRWFADRASGAAQALGSITGSMGFTTREELLPVLETNGYRDRFAAAFPAAAEPLSIDNYGAALEAYQRTLRTPAAFDAWLDGDDAALTSVQLRGLTYFLELGCAGCHNGPLLGGNSLQRFGVFDDYWTWTGSVEPSAGLMDSSKKPEDRNLFRVQPLRNTATTMPYFHDGSVPELRRAIDVMARAQLGLELSGTTLDELAAFLDSLTGEPPVNFSAPAGIPFMMPATSADNSPP